MNCSKKMADINWSFWLTFLVIALFILFIAVGIMQSFCYIVTATDMKDPKIYIFLGIILVGIIICPILFQRIYGLLLLYNDMEKRKIQLLIDRYKEDNITKNETISDLRNEIFRLQDLLSDDVFKANHDDMAQIYTNLGKIFFDRNKNEDAEKLYSKALDLYKSLAKEKPNIYNECVAKTYCKLAEVQIKKVQYSAAKRNYEKAIEYYIKLVKDKPEKYSELLAQTYFDLASLLKDIKNSKDVSTLFVQAMRNYVELAKSDTNKSIEWIAKIYNKLIPLISDELIPSIKDEFDNNIELKETIKKMLKNSNDDNPDRNDILKKIKNLLNITE